MTTIYTKTALKKIKKGDLVQMFLDQQARLVDDRMDSPALPRPSQEFDRVVEENEKLTRRIGVKSSECSYYFNEEKKHQKHIREASIDLGVPEVYVWAKIKEKSWRSRTAIRLKAENEKLKEENEKLKAHNEKLKVENIINERKIEHLYQTGMEAVQDAHKVLIGRVEELMKENEELQKDNEKLAELGAEQINELKLENDKLKRILKSCLFHLEDSLKADNADLRDKIETLEDDLFGYSSSDE